jgi:hypothetical protein
MDSENGLRYYSTEIVVCQRKLDTNFDESFFTEEHGLAPAREAAPAVPNVGTHLAVILSG